MAILGTIKTLFEDKAKTKPLFPRTSAEAVTCADGSSVERRLTRTEKTIILSANNWSNDEYIINDALIKIDTNQIIIPGLNITLDQRMQLERACIQDGGQGNGFLKLKSTHITPTIDIPIRVIFSESLMATDVSGTINNLNTQITNINATIGNLKNCKCLWSGAGQAGQTITLNESMDNYSVLVFCCGTTGDEWINTNTYPVEYFKTRNAQSSTKSIIMHNWDSRYVCAYCVSSTQIGLWNYSGSASLRAVYGVK